MKISNNCLDRMLEYKNAIAYLKALGFTKIFSHYLADAVGVTGMQVRKDFSTCRLPGNKRGGYNIDSLQDSLNSLLRKRVSEDIVLVGAGNLGCALAKYKGFEKEGFRIVAAFDINPAKYNKKSSFPIHPIHKLQSFIKSNKIKIGIIAVPELVAQQVLDLMVAAGIEGVLNFAPCWLRNSPDTCTVQNVNLAHELEKLIYHVGMRTGSAVKDLCRFQTSRHGRKKPTNP